jgi:cytochrome c biogenesis protein CcmG/thiol:disulfide interchange protein DsbE
VYGVPETFVIDKKGVIRDKYTGAVTIELWQQTILPLITKLQAESA